MAIADVRPGAPDKPPPVDVVDVSQKPVPFLRPLEWVATALRSFRERPLPGTYSTEARPTFDLFGTSALPNATVEANASGLGQIEVSGTEIPGTKWRQYLSLDVVHDDGATAHQIRFARIVPAAGGGFDVVIFAASDVLAAGQHFTARNISVPPLGFISADVDAIGLGAQLFLRTFFIELDVGEPHGAVS